MDIGSFPSAGIVVDGAANVVIGGATKNVLHTNAGPGVFVGTTGAVAASNTTVSNNFIGTNTAGTSGDGNCVAVVSGCAGVVVGASATTTLVSSNVISGTLHGADRRAHV